MVGPLLVTLIAVLDAAQVINGVRDVDVAAAVVELKSLRDASAHPGDDPVSPNLAAATCTASSGAADRGGSARCARACRGMGPHRSLRMARTP